ncbi:hypothetical protein IJ00_22170 [Calothrix sp. 336/3]|nr:hypothetical protein IJ00_22170 [Calothrix sp. 336/3]
MGKDNKFNLFPEDLKVGAADSWDDETQPMSNPCRCCLGLTHLLHKSKLQHDKLPIKPYPCNL